MLKKLIIFLAVLSFAKVVFADETVPCASSEGQALYKTVEQGRVSADVGVILKQNCSGSCTAAGSVKVRQIRLEARILEVSILARGKGEGGRDWVPEKPVLHAGKEAFKPTSEEKYWVDKQSIAKGAAVAVFTALGAMDGLAEKAAASEGKVCPVTGEKLSEGAAGHDERTGLEKGIDTVGKAAGMGLIASQAKGQITGLKTCFDLTGKDPEALKNLTLDTRVRNAATGKTVFIKDIPVLGFLFGPKGQAGEKKELEIMVTPRITNPPGE